MTIEFNFIEASLKFSFFKEQDVIDLKEELILFSSSCSKICEKIDLCIIQIKCTSKESCEMSFESL